MKNILIFCTIAVLIACFATPTACDVTYSWGSWPFNTSSVSGLSFNYNSTFVTTRILNAIGSYIVNGTKYFNYTVIPNPDLCRGNFSTFGDLCTQNYSLAAISAPTSPNVLDEANGLVGTLWLNDPTVDWTGGFITKFTYFFRWKNLVDYGSPGQNNFKPGDGFFFGFQSNAANWISKTGKGYYGLLDLWDAAGLTMTFDPLNATNTATLAVQAAADHSEINNWITNHPPTGTKRTTFTGNDELIPVNFTIFYDTLTSPNMLRVCSDDGTVLLEQRVNLFNYMSSTSHAYLGFGTSSRGYSAATGYNIDTRQYLTSWNVRSYGQDDKLLIRCRGSYSLYINGASVTLPNYPQILTLNSADAYELPSQSWNYTDVIAFTASAASSPYCVVEVRQSYTAPLPINNYIKCTNSASAGWMNVGFDDSSWDAPVIVGSNNFGSSHLANVRETANKFWTSDTANPMYCRAHIPRFCFPNQGLSRCVNFEQCDNSTNLCTCPSPYYGVDCNLIGNPDISSISPTYGSALGGTPVQVSGTNFSSSVDFCAFNGTTRMDLTIFKTNSLIVCITPAGIASTNTTISIKRSDGTGIISNSVQYRYTAPLQIKSFSPTSLERSEINRKVTITGANFDTSLPIYCRFSPTVPAFDPVLAIITDSSALSCDAPVPLKAARITIALSNNMVDWVTNSSLSFVFRVTASPYCRDWIAETNGQEFPFVKVPTGFVHYPTDVANEMQVTVSPGSTTSFNGTEVVDLDFCCGRTTGSAECGAQFNMLVPTVTVNVTLRTTALVNELNVAWFEPCGGLPSAYQVNYVDHLGVVHYIADVDTTRSCVSITSDNDAVSICTTYFDPVQANAVQIKFTNSSLPKDSDGASLYEIAANGIYLDAPYAISLSNSSAWNTSTMALAADTTITFPTFGITLTNIAGSSDGLVYSSVPITVTLFDLDNLKRQTTTLQGTLTQSLNASSIGSLFSDLSLTNIHLGNFQLQFTSVNLQDLALNFTIVPGVPKQVVLTTPNQVKIATLDLKLDPVVVCLLDQLNNPATTDTPLTVTATASSGPGVQTNLTGVLQDTINSTCVTFSNIHITPAPSANHQISFSVPGLLSTDLYITVNPGPPKVLSLSPLPSAIDNLSPLMITQPVVTLTDILGATVSSANYTVVVDVLAVGSAYPAKDKSGLQATVNNGKATFTDLSFTGQRGASYVLRFYVESDPTISANQTIYIRKCEEQTARDHTTQAQSGYECVCLAGFGFDNETKSCVACAQNTFKAHDSNEQCLDCAFFAASTDTDGQTGLSYCYCVKGLFNASLYDTDGEFGCLPCPDGGICIEGLIVGTQQGYWRPSDLPATSTIFYPCHKDSPSRKEVEASLDACPGSPTALVSLCSTGYTGPRCLTCDSGYGATGPFCETCPDPSLNYFFVAACFLIILIVLVFLVIQGKTAKNKEAVSSKILLNHIQMLALLSAVATAWLDPFQTLLTIGGIATLMDSRIVVVDCVFTVDYYYKFAFYIAIPLMTLIGSGIVHLIYYLIKIGIIYFIVAEPTPRAETRKQLTSQYILSLTVITFITYPAVCMKVMEIFDCTVHVEDKTYLNADPAKQCYTSDYYFWVIFGYIVLVVYCIGVPIVAFIMLWRYRNLDNPHVQMVLRFFYDGFKPKRYFWEIIVLLRKFLITMVIIISRARGALFQIYGFVWIVQAALLLHIIFRPYISARQFRLELWSLVSVLVTLGVSLFIPTLSQTDESSKITAYVLSSLVFILNFLVIAAFIFFITRGLMRRFLSNTWKSIVSCWNRYAPRKMQKGVPTITKVTTFFEMFAQSDDEAKSKFYTRLATWWSLAPNYQRRRFMVALLGVSKGTIFEKFSKSRGGTRSTSYYGSKRGSVVNTRGSYMEDPISTNSFYSNSSNNFDQSIIIQNNRSTDDIVQLEMIKN